MQHSRVNQFLFHLRKLVPAAGDGEVLPPGAILNGVNDMGYSFEFEPAAGASTASFTRRERSVHAIVDQCLTAYEAGDRNALFDLGVVFSTGSNGAPRDLIEAHKWFNLAAASGHEEAAMSRSEIAAEMSARDIAEAQRRARAYMAPVSRYAA